MRLKLDIPAEWPCLVPDTQWEPIPSVTLTIEPLAPISTDLTAWGDRIVLLGVDPTQYRVRNVEDLKTDAGWPVTIFVSDIVSILPQRAPVEGDLAQPTSGPRVRERRMHGLYVLEDQAGVVVVRSTMPARFDAVMPQLRRALLTGDLDWKDDRPLTLAELWRGLEIS